MSGLTIVSGEIEAVSTFSLLGKGGECHAWHDSIKTSIEKDWIISCNIIFEQFNRDAVGRHGGFHLFGNKVGKGNRSGGESMIIDWIDRKNDHGFRLYELSNRITNLRSEMLTEDTCDGDWTFIYKAEYRKLVFIKNGQVVVEHDITNPRGEHLGFWCWGGCKMTVKDLKIFC